jgi:hypothetical protein
VLRGGGFNNNARNCRAAYRNNNHPENDNDNVGFRGVVVFREHSRAGRACGRSPESRSDDRRAGSERRAVPPDVRVAGRAPAGEEEGPARRQ